MMVAGRIKRQDRIAWVQLTLECPRPLQGTRPDLTRPAQRWYALCLASVDRESIHGSATEKPPAWLVGLV